MSGHRSLGLSPSPFRVLDLTPSQPSELSLDHGHVPSPFFMSSSNLLGLGVVSSATLSRVRLDRARPRTTVRAIYPQLPSGRSSAHSG